MNVMIGGAITLFEERSTRCSRCGAPVPVFQTKICNACEFEHSEEQITAMRTTANYVFIRSGLVALAFFPILITSVYMLNEKYAFISKCSCLVFNRGC